MKPATSNEVPAPSVLYLLDNRHINPHYFFPGPKRNNGALDLSMPKFKIPNAPCYKSYITDLLHFNEAMPVSNYEKVSKDSKEVSNVTLRQELFRDIKREANSPGGSSGYSTSEYSLESSSDGSSTSGNSTLPLKKRKIIVKEEGNDDDEDDDVNKLVMDIKQDDENTSDDDNENDSTMADENASDDDKGNCSTSADASPKYKKRKITETAGHRRIPSLTEAAKASLDAKEIEDTYYPNMAREYPDADKRTPEEAVSRLANSLSARKSRAKSNAIIKKSTEIALKTDEDNMRYRRTVAALRNYISDICEAGNFVPINLDCQYRIHLVCRTANVANSCAEKRSTRKRNKK